MTTQEKLSREYSGKIKEIYTFRDDLHVVVKPQDLVEICRFLKTDSDLKFNFLSCITAADYLNLRPQRFEVVYVLFSIANSTRIILKVRVDENQEIPTLHF